MARRQQLLLTLLLAALALLSTWTLLRYEPWRPPPARPAQHAPDYYFRDFRALRLDAQGRPRHRVTGERAVHYADDDSVEVEASRAVYYPDEGEPWHMESPLAHITGGGDEVFFPGAVHVKRDAGAHNRQVVLDTTALRVRPDAGYGETDEAVFARSHDARIRGTGLRAYLDEGRLQLLSDVHSAYQPDHH